MQISLKVILCQCLTWGRCLIASQSLKECLGRLLVFLLFLMPTKPDVFFFLLLLPLLYSHTCMHVHTCTYTQVSNKQRSIGRLNNLSACYCFELTCTFQLLLQMFHENNTVSQGCNARFMFVPGVVRIAIFTLSEAVISFKLNPLMLQVGRLPCPQH